jgi:hypothetical protein
MKTSWKLLNKELLRIIKIMDYSHQILTVAVLKIIKLLPVPLFANFTLTLALKIK